MSRRPELTAQLRAIPDELRRLYVDEEESIASVARQLEASLETTISTAAVRNALLAQGVRLRSTTDDVCRAQVSRARLAMPAPVRAMLLANVGGCGSPTCSDPSCDVPSGRCHRAGCELPAVIAYRTERALR